MLAPRQYQQDAHDDVIAAWRAHTKPVLVEAATGAGKSIIIAMLAKTLYDLSGGKRVLCLAPSAELVKQNAAKYVAIGERCSIFSASVSKSLRHQVIFATPGTFKAVAKRMGHQFAGVIVDECHGITTTIKNIIEDMKETAPNLRVCGLSATPYRLRDGFIFKLDPSGKALPAHIAHNPYFDQCVYAISARYLIAQGFLTPLRAGDINAAQYDTGGLKLQANGQFSAATVGAAFEGWGRETAAIVADVVAQTQQASGVMIFAATVRHAGEVMASLHPDNARIVTGETPKGERAQIIADFNAGRFMYLVNIGVLAVGFDSPRVSHIAILRATESVSLLQQIMGRGMRLYDGKAECVILDYAENIQRHCPDGDLYKPQITAAYQGAGELLEAKCESCSKTNTFSVRQNEDGHLVDDYGYFTTLIGQRIETEVKPGHFVPMPAHFGRRCVHTDRTGARCDYYWSSKECGVCEHKNDIAARFCSGCKSELINPAAKLILMHGQHKKDPTKPQCDAVLDLSYSSGLSRAGNDMKIVEITTSRRKLIVYLLENNEFSARKKMAFMRATDNFQSMPASISYVKNGDFWEVLGFNATTDDEALNAKLRSTV